MRASSEVDVNAEVVVANTLYAATAASHAVGDVPEGVSAASAAAASGGSSVEATPAPWDSAAVATASAVYGASSAGAAAPEESGIELPPYSASAAAAVGAPVYSTGAPAAGGTGAPAAPAASAAAPAVALTAAPAPSAPAPPSFAKSAASSLAASASSRGSSGGGSYSGAASSTLWSASLRMLAASVCASIALALGVCAALFPWLSVNSTPLGLLQFPPSTVYSLMALGVCPVPPAPCTFVAWPAVVPILPPLPPDSVLPPLPQPSFPGSDRNGLPPLSTLPIFQGVARLEVFQAIMPLALALLYTGLALQSLGVISCVLSTLRLMRSSSTGLALPKRCLGTAVTSMGLLAGAFCFEFVGVVVAGVLFAPLVATVSSYNSNPTGLPNTPTIPFFNVDPTGEGLAGAAVVLSFVALACAVASKSLLFSEARAARESRDKDEELLARGHGAIFGVQPATCCC